MKVTFLPELDRLLLVGYVLAVVCLNATMYLIAAFYHKKFGEATPRQGFVVSIILSALYAGSVFVGDRPLLGIIQSSLLILSSAASALSSINLYFKMRKTRK